MFWKKKPKPPTLMDKLKKKWMAITFVFGFLPSIYSGYLFIQPDFVHLEEHLEVAALLDVTNGSIVAEVNTDHLPNISTTVQLIIDGEHIQHLHFPQGIPTEKGKSYAIGEEVLVINAHISWLPDSTDVTVRFVFDGLQMLKPYVIAAKGKLYATGGPSDEASNSAYAVGKFIAAFRF